MSHMASKLQKGEKPMTSLLTVLSGIGDWVAGVGGILDQFSTRAFLEAMAGLALLASASGFLFLVWRVSCGVQQLIASCTQREQTEQKIYEIFREYMDNQRLFNEQLWTASSALSPC
jgi:hypothetical protein